MEAAEIDGKDPRDLGSALGPVVNLSVILGRSLNLAGHQSCYMSSRK